MHSDGTNSDATLHIQALMLFPECNQHRLCIVLHNVAFTKGISIFVLLVYCEILSLFIFSFTYFKLLLHRILSVGENELPLFKSLGVPPLKPKRIITRPLVFGGLHLYAFYLCKHGFFRGLLSQPNRMEMSS